MYVYVWYCTCVHCVYPCLYTWNPLIDKYRGNGVNHCSKGSLTGVTEVAEITMPRVVSSSQVGVDPFWYWLLGTSCCSDCGWLVVMNGDIQWS